MLGQALGLTDAEFDALQGDYRESPLFDARERAVLAWAEAMTLNTAKSDDVVWNELRKHFNEAEIVEISLASAMFNMINRLNDSFRHRARIRGIQPAAARRGRRDTRHALEDYACRICSSAAPGEEKRKCPVVHAFSSPSRSMPAPSSACAALPTSSGTAIRSTYCRRKS